MKRICLREAGDYKTTEVLRQVAGASPQRAMSPDEMRKRIGILDALDAIKPGAEAFDLEDAQHALLVDALNAFPWGVANRDLLRIIDDVIEAQEPLR